MDEGKRDERNERRRKAYSGMDANKKANFLKQRRLQYALRKTESRATASTSQVLPAQSCGHGQLCTSELASAFSEANAPSSDTLNPSCPAALQLTAGHSSPLPIRSALSRRGHIDHTIYPATRSALCSPLRSAPSDSQPELCSSLLPVVPNCTYCHAKRFSNEPRGFCCSEGEISIASPKMPSELVRLFTASDPECVEFRKYARTYNNNLAFTTFAARKDNDLLKNKQGIYTFKVQGKVHHYLAFLTRDTDSPSGLQFYFYDPDAELQERLSFSSKFSRNLMVQLMQLMSANPYARFLRQVKDLPCLDAYKLYLVSSPELDQRVYNEPTCNDVSAIISTDGENDFNPQSHIQIYSKNAAAYRICHNFGCYDPLQYPLLLARGVVGWHCGIEKLPPNRQKRGYRCRDPLSGMNAFAGDADQFLTQEKLGKHRSAMILPLVHSSGGFTLSYLICYAVFQDGVRKRNNVSCRQYYCYKLQMRDGDRSMLLHTGRLLQQFIVDMFIKVETSRLEYVYKQQKEIRTECLRGILDSIAGGNTTGSTVGRRVILPPSFVGGPRDMKKSYMDAMCLVQNFGKPDFFLTMTCNPAWPEIANHLLPGEMAQNRPDLLARVFRAKLEMLKKDLLKDHIFGVPIACVYSIEFQKRGLPHAHLLLIMDRDSKPLNPEAYDRFISAELPNPSLHPRLHELVLRHMVHGPCGLLNPKCPCMRDKKCKNRFPKDFVQYTTHGCNSYPHYRRRDTGISARVRGHVIDNRWIVPYNPYLLEKYDCHINVEICSTIKLVKYIYKYIYKGPDKIAYQLAFPVSEDEIKQYQDGRWVGPPEAAWRMYGFDLFDMQPAVVALQLHLPDNYLVSFTADQDLNTVASNNFLSRTMLMQFFYMNRTNDRAADLCALYKDFPKYFVWDSSKRTWTDRKKGKFVGRVVSASPREGERYYLRLLLNHVPGPRSYDDLLTVNSYLHATFREAALARNLLTTDADLDSCLEEATMYQMPRQLRHLFASILVFCSPSDPRKLWDKYADSLCDDYTRAHAVISLSRFEIRLKGLEDLSLLLDDMGKQISNYNLGPEADLISRRHNISKEMMYERSIAVDDADLLNVHRLNEQQQRAYDVIMEKIMKDEPSAFFIDGPGGTGKTYLYKSVLATLRSQQYIALATATSGVAACVLPGGRTAHSRFKLPLQDDDRKIANVSRQFTTAKLLREAKVIIWDEAPMAHKDSIEAFSEMLKDIMEVDEPFGNKVVLFGGDFRQVLPVVTNAAKQQQLDATLFSSRLWPALTKLKLTENMRARADPYFTEFLLRIGDGTEPEDENGDITLPANMVIPFVDREASLQELIDFVYPVINAFTTDARSTMDRALLAPTNDCVDDINEAMLRKMPGTVKTYISTDLANDPQHRGDYDDFLNSLTPSSLPPHELILKPNSPLMLLRNLSLVQGLCNGTRLICRELRVHTIVAEISSGPYAGTTTILHKIPLECSNEDKCAIPFKRYQIPVRLCIAMTINKAQGQTLERVGVYLREPVFSHGQLYVALSRARKSSSIKVLIAPPTFTDTFSTNKTKNIVYREILERVQHE